MASAISRHVGARYIVVTDVNDYRLELAMRMGATRALNVTREDIRDAMSELGMLEGFDVGMEMSGAGQAFRDLLAAMNHGGKVAMLGIPPNDVSIDWNEVIFKGLVLKGVYGPMLQSGLDVRPVLTHRFPCAEYEKAFEVMRSGRSGKVVLDWRE
jgi:threonine 3-dehydrogenase